MMLDSKEEFQDLKITGLDAARSHAVTGAMVRIYFQLSAAPPLGWSYLFTTIWQSLAYSSKRKAGTEGDGIWLECVLEEVATHHIEQLENAVRLTNARYQDELRQRVFNKHLQAELEFQLRLRLNDLSRTLYPTGDDARSRFWGRVFFRKMKHFLFPEIPDKRHKKRA